MYNDDRTLELNKSKKKKQSESDKRQEHAKKTFDNTKQRKNKKGLKDPGLKKLDDRNLVNQVEFIDSADVENEDDIIVMENLSGIDPLEEEVKKYKSIQKRKEKELNDIKDRINQVGVYEDDEHFMIKYLENYFDDIAFDFNINNKKITVTHSNKEKEFNASFINTIYNLVADKFPDLKDDINIVFDDKFLADRGNRLRLQEEKESIVEELASLKTMIFEMEGRIIEQKHLNLERTLQKLQREKEEREEKRLELEKEQKKKKQDKIEKERVKKMQLEEAKSKANMQPEGQIDIEALKEQLKEELRKELKMEIIEKEKQAEEDLLKQQEKEKKRKEQELLRQEQERLKEEELLRQKEEERRLKEQELLRQQEEQRLKEQELERQQEEERLKEQELLRQQEEQRLKEQELERQQEEEKRLKEEEELKAQREEELEELNSVEELEEIDLHLPEEETTNILKDEIDLNNEEDLNILSPLENLGDKIGDIKDVLGDVAKEDDLIDEAQKIKKPLFNQDMKFTIEEEIEEETELLEEEDATYFEVENEEDSKDLEDQDLSEDGEEDEIPEDVLSSLYELEEEEDKKPFFKKFSTGKKKTALKIFIGVLFINLIIAASFLLKGNYKNDLVNAYNKTYVESSTLDETMNISFETETAGNKINDFNLNVNRKKNKDLNETYKSMQLESADYNFLWERFNRHDLLIMKSAFDPQYIVVDNLTDFGFDKVSSVNPSSSQLFQLIDKKVNNKGITRTKETLGESKEKYISYEFSLPQGDAETLYNNIFKSFIEQNQSFIREESEVERKLSHKKIVIEEVEELANIIYSNASVKGAKVIISTNKNGELKDYRLTFNTEIPEVGKVDMKFNNAIASINNPNLELEKESFTVNSINFNQLTPRLPKGEYKEAVSDKEIEENVGTLKELEELDKTIKFDEEDKTVIESETDIKEEKILPQELIRQKQLEKEAEEKTKKKVEETKEEPKTE